MKPAALFRECSWVIYRRGGRTVLFPLWLLSYSVEFNVLKERMSRVCIVVLEEVEDDSPVFISKLPQESKSLHSPFSGNVLVSYESFCWLYFIELVM